MAEVAIKIRSSSGYVPDDVVDAFSEQRICVCNLHMICFKQNQQRALANAVAGLLPVGDIAQTYLEQTSQFRFERLSPTRGKVTRLSDANEIEFDDGQPFVQHDGKTVHMNMGIVIAKKIRAAQFPIFGTPGNEIWYGGRTTYDDVRLSLIWDDVETKTPERRTDNKHIRWPFGTSEIRTHVPLLTVPFSNDEIVNLLEPLYVIDGNGDYRWEARLSDDTVDVVFAQTAPEPVDADDNRSWTKVVAQKRRNQLNAADAIYATLGTSRSELEDPQTAVDKRDQMTPITDVAGFHDKLTGTTRQRFKENRAPVINR